MTKIKLNNLNKNIQNLVYVNIPELKLRELSLKKLVLIACYKMRSRPKIKRNYKKEDRENLRQLFFSIDVNI